MTDVALDYTTRLVNTLMLMPERSDAMENLLDMAAMTYSRIEQAVNDKDLPMIERGHYVEWSLKKFFEDNKIGFTEECSDQPSMVDAEKLEKFARDAKLLNCLSYI